MLAKLSAEMLATYPHTQAIYLFGSEARAAQQPESDTALACLLPPQQAGEAGSLQRSEFQQRQSGEARNGV